MSPSRTRSTRKAQIIYLTAPFLALFLNTCTNKAVKEFPLTIIVSDKLGNTNTDKLPDNVVGLSQLLESCPKSNFVPVPTLKRIGISGAEIPLKTDLNGGFASNKSNPNLIKRQVESHLRSIEIGNSFSTPTADGVDLRAILDKYLSTINKNAKIYYYSNNGSDDINGNKVYNSTDLLRATIANQLCEEASVPVIIIYNPPSQNPSPVTEGAGSEMRNDVQSKNDLLIEELHKQNTQAKANPVELKAVDERISTNMDPKDYRFIYEKVRNRIFGDEHHEAFDLLKEAARIAIESNEAEKMLFQVEQDKDGDLWKLSHGHPTKWNPIIEALSKNEKEILNSHHQTGPPHHR